jgi:hypothetical protein
MKEFLLRTKREPCTVVINISTSGERIPIYVLGYDPLTPFTFYFRSWFLLTGDEEITLNCPLSPRFLKVCIWTKEGYSFKVLSVDKVPLERTGPVDDPIVKFIEEFAKYGGTYWPGFYYGESVPFVVEVVRRIWTKDGRIHPTPARISVEEPVIEVSMERFREATVPERIAFLLHETAHNYINSDPDSEGEADVNGLQIYQELGYPKIESMNAFASIMSDTDENNERMLYLISL